MRGEGSHKDYKSSYKWRSSKAKLELIKDVVAIANAGGGTIVFGHDEIDPCGIDAATTKALDSARVAAQVQSYIRPARIQLSHEIEEVREATFQVSLHIGEAEIPIVMARAGFWAGANTKVDNAIFREGDIWTRHSSSNQRATYEDMRRWFMQARSKERADVLDRITTLVNLPEGSTIHVLSHSGSPIDSPEKLLQSAMLRREWDSNHLLTGEELLWIFQSRGSIESEESQVAMLIASSLRRSPTLFYWLLLAEPSIQLIEDEILAALDASDRDKSDAKRSLLEVAAIYLSTSSLRKVLAGMRNSKYKHFRDQANAWQDRRSMRRETLARIRNSKHENRKLVEHNEDELESLASEVSMQLLVKKQAALSAKLGSITRVLWFLRSENPNP
jgi:hypothetical protein